MPPDPCVDRRWVIGQLTAATSSVAGIAGCLNDGRTEQVRLEEVAPATESPRPPPDATIELAGWNPAGGQLLATLAAAVDDIEVTTAAPASGDRATFDARLGDRLATFDPPSTFLTVAGAELARYHRALHLHPIPDLAPAIDESDRLPAATDAVSIDGTPVAVPVATWVVNRWCYRPDILERIGVAVDEITDPQGFAATLDRIEAQADMTGIAIVGDGSSRLGLLCDCLGAIGGRTGLGAAVQGTLDPAQLEAAAQACSQLLDGRARQVSDGRTAAKQVATGDVAFTRATPQRMRRFAETDSTEVSTTVLPAFGRPLRVEILALPYPKRNPSPVATERLLQAVQRTMTGEEITGIPGLLSTDRATWQSASGPTATSHHQRYGAAAEVILAPSTGCGMPAGRRWRARTELASLSANPTPDDIRAAVTGPLAEN